MKNYEHYVSKADIEAIHENSLRILSEVGVNFEHEKALEVFREHGARIEGQIVFIDEKLINEVLQYAKKEFVIQSCKGDLRIGSGEQYRAAVNGHVYRHHHNGRIEKLTNEDVINQFKLSDTSKVINVGEINYFLNFEGFTLDQRVFGNLALMMKYSNKPMLMPCANTFGISDAEEASRAFRKSLELVNQFEGNDNYHNVYIINTLSPLTYDHDPIEKILILAEMEQPILITPCAMPMMTAPPSVASMIAMTNAEVLAGYTLAKLLNPEIPVVYGNTSGSTDMRAVQLAIGTPESALVTFATAGLADRYGLPYRTGGALSDAKALDVQAGAESMMMIHATKRCEADIVLHAAGCMGTFNVIDFGKFLIDEEIHLMVERLERGIDCSSEKFCMDMVKEVGPRGNFLKGRTPKMYREEFYLTKYFSKEDPNHWQSKGSLSVADVTEAQVQKRIDSYTPPSITKEQQELLDPYIYDEYKNEI